MKQLLIAAFYLLVQQSVIAQGFSKAEYFFDTDPGIGNGISIKLTGTLNTLNFTANIPASLSTGFHVLGLRVKNNNGKWSLFEHRAFYVLPPAAAAVVINAAEYFFDADPGVGNGISTPVGASGTIINFTANIPSSLAAGFHTLAIRTKSSDGEWSLFEHRAFYVSSTALIAGNITAAEYFFDTDPGVNNGTSLTINTPGALVNQTFNVTALNTLSQGQHYLSIRVKNANGKWSLFDFQTFTVSGVLPVSVLTFVAIEENNKVKLSWQTTNEINSSHFIVQHSVTGSTFNNIGRLAARNTSGNNDYSLTDASPVDGVNFYRLQMVDIDGKTTYSPIVKIAFAGKNELQVFPNPAKNTITVNGLQSKGIIKIIAADGKVVKQMAVTTSSMLVDISNWAKGMYILQYNNEHRTEQVKIIKQ